MSGGNSNNAAPEKDTSHITQKNAQVDGNRVEGSLVGGERSKLPAQNDLGESAGVADTHVDSAPPLEPQLTEQNVKVIDAPVELQSNCQVHSHANKMVNDIDRNGAADNKTKKENKTVEIGKEDKVASTVNESDITETVKEIAMVETTKENEIDGTGEEKRLAETEKEKDIAVARNKNEIVEKETANYTTEAEKENEMTEINTENENAKATIKVMPEGCEAPLREEKLIPEGLPLKEENEIVECSTPADAPSHTFNFDHFLDGDDSGTEEEQSSFMKELENFYKGKSLDFKPPKFYGEGLNCLKLWRQVTRLGGYEQVTSCKLWRQVGESFKPPKTCTTVSWTFRIFYEKALLEYEKHKIQTGELQVPVTNLLEPIDSQVGGSQASGSGRARRDAAARAMQGWHSQRLLGNGEVGDPIIKDKNPFSAPKKDKNLKSISSLKKRKASSLERVVKVARTNSVKSQGDIMVVDIGNPADWVKINVRRTKDCFEVYALVPGLLREEVQVQSDPAGRLIISGEPEQPDNPWGVTPFKKVITLPSRIDPHQTSAVVTLHGQLFVRAPFDQSDL